MKLRNKKTGAIYSIEDIDLGNNADGIWLGMTKYNSLAELNEEWEDYKEPKGYWYYDTTCGRVEKINHNIDKEMDSSIGNCFDTREEAEKAVEKLKAWKRLRDAGIKLEIVTIGHKKYLEPTAEDSCTFDEAKNIVKDFEFIFGGEDE